MTFSLHCIKLKKGLDFDGTDIIKSKFDKDIQPFVDKVETKKESLCLKENHMVTKIQTSMILDIDLKVVIYHHHYAWNFQIWMHMLNILIKIVNT